MKWQVLSLVLLLVLSFGCVGKKQEPTSVQQIPKQKQWRQQKAQEQEQISEENQKKQEKY